MTIGAQAFKHLEAGGLLIVETRESARALRHAYDRQQRASGRKAWPSPRVFTLDDWLASLWQESRLESSDRRILRSDSQVVRVLAAIIDDLTPVPLLNVPATARAALRSWRRMHDWSVSLTRAATGSEEERSFSAWTRSLLTRQREEGWIDRAQLAGLIAASLPYSVRHERIALMGFDDRVPAVEGLVTALGRCAVSIERLAPAQVPARRTFYAAVNPEDELIAAARWARTRLESDAGARLAIIVPDLAERRAAVRMTLDRIVDPASLFPTRPEHLPLYAIIGGEPLSERAVVSAAFSILGLLDAQLAWTDAGRLLRSPYLRGAVEEQGARARFDRHLRELGQVSWAPADLVRLARSHACTRWAEDCEAALRVLGSGRERLRAGAWAERFGAALRAAGWPEGRPLGSVEHQAATRLREVLGEFAALDPLLPALSIGAARAELERLVRDTGFQPESGDPPIRVLDTLDHPGPLHDGLWICGLTADRWPLPADPDSFLPIEQQRALGMPWATAAGALASSQRAMERVLGAAPELVLSWPHRIDESECEASPLIPAGLPRYAPATAALTFAEQVHAARGIEAVDDRGSPLAMIEVPLRGGTRVLELQAKCPFRAFGELRLGARRLESPRPGISPLVRGQLAHRALERLWRELESQARLNALAANDLESLVERVVGAACADFAGNVSRRLLELERGWLAKAVVALLGEERKRAPFRVSALEIRERFAVGGAVLELRIDRIDELDAAAGGGEFVLDYKTGRPAAPRWLGSGRDMPQLPAYAISRRRPPAGLALAQLNLRTPGFRGVASSDAARRAIREPRGAPGDEQELNAQLEDWRAWIEALVRDHVAGDARVSPVSAQACRECALAALCRIGADAPAEEEGGDGD
jgi:probable DNA repair protein